MYRGKFWFFGGKYKEILKKKLIFRLTKCKISPTELKIEYNKLNCIVYNINLTKLTELIQFSSIFS